MLSYQSLMPAGAGTPRYEKPELWFGTANWHGGFSHAPRRPQRGTSPSPREVFDRATFSHSAGRPFGLVTCFRTNRSCRLAPGMRDLVIEVFGCGWCHPSPLDSGLRRNDEFGGGNHSFRTNRSCRLAPAQQGMTMRPGR